MLQRFFKNEVHDRGSSEDVVYEFAEILGQLNQPILDVRMLPRPKNEILSAFIIHLAMLKARQQAVPTEDIAKDISLVESVMYRVFDFQSIDPEDILEVMAVNTSEE